MSEGRGKYSAAPLNGLKHNRGGSYRMQPDRPDRDRRGGNRNTFVFLQVCMSFILPVLFIVALVLGYTELHWVFLALAAASLLVMWGAHAFVPQARTTMTLIYVALMIVSLGAALWFTHPMINTGSQDPNAQDTSVSALFGRDVTAKDVQEYTSQQQTTAEVETPVPTQSAQSAAQAKLDLFMGSWMSLDYQGMLPCCVPSWVNAQENPEHAIFKIRGTSIPVDYDPISSSGSDADDSRTITMVAKIDKGTGKEPQDYRYEVLMLRVNGEWYVDPASLSSATEIKNEVTPTPEITLQPTYTPDMEMRLYYNPDGGSYYHKSENCDSVDRKYLPLKGTFLYKELGNAPYNTLKPCTKCNPPGRTD